jgi:hypothetical protein
MMRSLEDHFSDSAIIRKLCISRLKQANARHEELFYNRINGKSKLSETHSSVDVLPPRRLWSRFRNKNRKLRSNEDQNLVALIRATHTLREEEPYTDWVVALNDRLQQIRSRALDETRFQFTAPKIRAIEKEQNSGKYRAIAIFNPDDQIIDGLTAKYLRELFDSLFCKSSIAFRCATPLGPPPNHHDAVEQIEHYRQRHSENGLYVAELDIKGFYDCVSHDLAQECFDKLIAQAKAIDTAFEIHPRALKIFKAYLDCYSFPKSVRKQFSFLLKDKEGSFSWPLDDLRRIHQRIDLRIGVPQGGALSCFIANCVLHQADIRVEEARRKCDAPFLYLRYCDDMILLSSDQKTCGDISEIYQQALAQLKLPVHPPESVQEYGRKLWNQKSRNPFYWGPPANPSTVPWIQFVGYQIRYDGLIRVRKSSIAKHKEKILSQTKRLLALIRVPKHLPANAQQLGIRKNARQILHRFRHKLIAMSVGKTAIHHDPSILMPKCWTAGFKLLHGKNTPLNTLKDLDRFRDAQIALIARQLKHLPKVNSRRRGVRIRPPRYYGYPFSYVAQFRAGKLKT